MTTEIAMWLFLLGPTTMWWYMQDLAFAARAVRTTGCCTVFIARKIRLVRLIGRKYCDAVKYGRFKNLTRYDVFNMNGFTLAGDAKHQYSAASGAQGALR
jgi:hypothetical protein